MHLTYPELEILKTVETIQADGESYVHVEQLVAGLNDPPLAEDRSRLLEGLRQLKKKDLIEFEVGEGIKITEGGIVALRMV